MWWPSPRRQPRPTIPAAALPGRPPPGPAERRSPGLAALFGGIGTAGDQRVLDLGAASGASLEVYGRYASQVRFADLCGPADEQREDSDWQAAVAALTDTLADEAVRYSIVVTWDRLDYLAPAARDDLVAHLTAHAEPGARLYAVVAETTGIPRHPVTYTLTGIDRVVVNGAGGDLRPHPRLTPAEVQRILDPFVVEHSFVLRTGSREYLAVLPR